MILNDAPYGSERSYNGLRLVDSLARKEGVEVRVFLMSDAVFMTKRGHKPPGGFYNLQVMLNKINRLAPERVDVCGVCMDARGIGTQRGAIEKLAYWTNSADKALTF